MADKFVWSGAVGANDGSTWEDAYTSGMRDWGAEAGFTPGTDFVYFRDSHSESSATTLTITGSTADSATRAVDVLSVVGADTGTAPGNLSNGASVTTTASTADIIINESIYVNGVNFFSEGDLALANSTADQNVAIEDCRLELTGDSTAQIRLGRTSQSANQGTLLKFVNVVCDFSDENQSFDIESVFFEWDGGSIAFDIISITSAAAENRFGDINMRGVDFSIMAGNSLIRFIAGSFVTTNRHFTFSRCKLGTGLTILDSGTIKIPGFIVESYNCQIGTDSDPAFQYEKHDARGNVESDTARFRTDGASDGERTNPYSLSMDTSVGSVRGYPGHALGNRFIGAWTDGDGSTAHTYRIYIASGGTLNDDDIWFELEGPNDADTSSMSAFKTTRVAPRTTAAAITTDAVSTWNGTDVGTLQQMDITYTPDKPGPVTARVFLAKATDRVSIDPKIYIDP